MANLPLTSCCSRVCVLQAKFHTCLHCRQLEAATDKLGKQLRGLAGLALRIVSVQPLGAASRRTAPFPPQPHPLAQVRGDTALPCPVLFCAVLVCQDS